jgi:hypothetical protein
MMFVLTIRTMIAEGLVELETLYLAGDEEKSLRLAKKKFFRDLKLERTEPLFMETGSWEWDDGYGKISWEGGYAEYTVTQLFRLME